MMLEIVPATFTSWKTNIAAKLKNAAHSTATCGESTRVETTVAMELAASWNPLITSKTNAKATVRMTMTQTALMGFTKPRSRCSG